MKTVDQVSDQQLVRYALVFLHANLDDDNLADLLEVGIDDELPENAFEPIAQRLDQLARSML